MAKYARLSGNKVVEIITLADGLVPGVDCITPELAKEIVQVKTEPTPVPGYIYDKIKAAFSPPPDPTIDEIKAANNAKVLVALAASDTGMVRTIEDILTALVVKGLILKTDIPQAVLDKISAREALRSQLK